MIWYFILCLALVAAIWCGSVYWALKTFPVEPVMPLMTDELRRTTPRLVYATAVSESYAAQLLHARQIERKLFFG